MLLTLSVSCPKCHAPPGAPCREEWHEVRSRTTSKMVLRGINCTARTAAARKIKAEELAAQGVLFPRKSVEPLKKRRSRG